MDRRPDAGPTERRDERRAPRCVRRRGALETSVRARVPAGLHRRAHQPSEGADAPRPSRGAPGQPARRGLRGRRARGSAARDPGGASRSPPGGGRPRGQGRTVSAMPTGLLLIHGWPLDARMWEPQLAAFGDRIPVVAPHLPGFGGTEGPEVLTMAEAALACVSALDEAGMDTAVTCGLSLGGYVAFELWRSARERIDGLVLANTRAEPDAEEGAAKRRAIAERLRAEGSDFL